MNDPSNLTKPHGKKLISEVTRTNLIDEVLSLGPIEGRLELLDFLNRIWPLHNMPSTDSRFSDAGGDIGQHMINNSDWDYRVLFYEKLSILEISDELFLDFLVMVVDPLVRKPAEQEHYVSMMNGHLQRDGFWLEQAGDISGYPVYQPVNRRSDFPKRIASLIFGSNREKPDIVIDNTLTGSIRVLNNPGGYLVYDRPISSTGLNWSELISWWCDNHPGLSDADNVENLRTYLLNSLSSARERFLWDAYYGIFLPIFGNSLPMLIPQVYFRYDPKTIRELGGKPRLPGQRIDFLLILRRYVCVVIEVDGKQHYAEGDTASPRIYTELVAADRELRLAGYEVYRFSGYELYRKLGEAVVQDFFTKLFRRHGVS